MSLVQLSALVAVTLLAGLSLLQGALVAGAPLGRLAWGGQRRVLPTGLRIGSAASIGVYAVCAEAALAGPGLVPALAGDTATSVTLWVMTAFFALGIPVNGLSRSKAERLVMTPITAALAALSLVLALH